MNASGASGAWSNTDACCIARFGAGSGLFKNKATETRSRPTRPVQATLGVDHRSGSKVSTHRSLKRKQFDQCELHGTVTIRPEFKNSKSKSYAEIGTDSLGTRLRTLCTIRSTSLVRDSVHAVRGHTLERLRRSRCHVESNHPQPSKRKDLPHSARRCAKWT
jgi:hypothetical protein